MEKRTRNKMTKAFTAALALAAGVGYVAKTQHDMNETEAREIFLDRPNKNITRAQSLYAFVRANLIDGINPTKNMEKRGECRINYREEKDLAVDYYQKNVFRQTQLLNQELRDKTGGSVILEEKLDHRTATSGEPGKVYYKFHDLIIEGLSDNPEILAQLESNQPWIFEAVRSGEPYGLTLFYESGAGCYRRVITKATYELQNGSIIECRDTNGNLVADKIREIKAPLPEAHTSTR